MPDHKVHTVMKEFKHGTLRSGSGAKVKNRKQAVAIAMSESGQSKKSAGTKKLRHAAGWKTGVSLGTRG